MAGKVIRKKNEETAMLQEHHHGHDHSPAGHIHVAGEKLKYAVLLTFLILLVEAAGGLWANSLALLSDAGHMLTDVASLVVAWAAVSLSARPPSKSLTYGYHRITILAALFNALTLVAIAFFIGGEAYRRILNPEPVQGSILLIIATIGLVVNIYIGLGMRGHSENVNIKSAMLHVMGDAAASAGVIVAGVVMYFTDWYILDPVLSILIAVLVAAGAWRIIKESYIVLMEGTPPGIKFEEVENAIRSIAGVKDVHDLHIWSLTSNRSAMSGHLVVCGNLTVNKSQRILNEIENISAERFNIGHTTFQFENDGHGHGQDMFSIDKDWTP
ncbi:MAG: cation diffusion facilitator family transporter [Firmicutes bacterium]|nr:cation diffusion facilitator family transporter [Bacillota bacterium]